jgi:hypothetical protein
MASNTSNVSVFITNYNTFAQSVHELTTSFNLLKKWVEHVLFEQCLLTVEVVDNKLKNDLTLFSRAVDLFRLDQEFLYKGSPTLPHHNNKETVCFCQLEKDCTEILNHKGQLDEETVGKMETIELNIFNDGPLGQKLDAVRLNVTKLIKVVEEKFSKLHFCIEKFSQGHIISITSKNDDGFVFYEDTNSSDYFARNDFRELIMTNIQSSLPVLKQKILKQMKMTGSQTSSTVPKSKEKKKSKTVVTVTPANTPKPKEEKKSETVVTPPNTIQANLVDNFIRKSMQNPSAVSLSSALVSSSPVSVSSALVSSSPVTSLSSSFMSPALSTPLAPAPIHSSPSPTQSLAPTFMTLSLDFPYKLFTGENYAANEDILRETFKTNIESSIRTSGENKLLALESVFCFILNGKVNFKGYIELLKETSNTVREEHLKCAKLKFHKDPATKDLRVTEYSEEVRKTLQFMNSFVHKMCCNVLQFLKNCSEYLRNGCPTALSFGYPFVIPFEKVEQFLIPDVMRELRHSVTREDELSVHLQVRGFLNIEAPLLECIKSTETWKLFQRPKENIEAIIAAFESIGFHDSKFLNTLQNPFLLSKLEEYFSPKNPFRTINSELSKYLETISSSVMDVKIKTAVKTKRDDGYGSLLTETPNPIASTSKKAKTNQTAVPNSKFLQEHQFEDDNYSEMSDSFHGDKNISAMVDDSCFKSDVNSQVGDDYYSATQESIRATTNTKSDGIRGVKERLSIMMSQWMELKHCVDQETAIVVDNAITVLDKAINKTIVVDAIEMMSFESTSPLLSHSSQIKDEVVEQMPLDSSNHPNSRVKKKIDIVELDVDNKNVKILTDREIEVSKVFLDGQFSRGGLLAPMPFSGQSQLFPRDIMVSRIHSCTMVVYVRILAGLFYNSNQLMGGGSEEYHYKNLVQLQGIQHHSMEHYYHTNFIANTSLPEEHNGDPFLQALQLIKVPFQQKLFLKIKISVLKDKNSFLESVRAKWKESKILKRKAKIAQDYSILYIAIDAEDNCKDQSSHVPLHADIDKKSHPFMETGVRQAFKYNLCAVVYRGEDGCVVFRVLAAMRDVNMFQHSVFDVSTAALSNSASTVCQTSFILPGHLSKQIENKHAFPATYSEGDKNFSAIGSFWYRTNADAIYNKERPLIECLQQTSFDAEGITVGTDILMNHLVKTNGWLSSSLVEIFFEKALKHYHSSSNILSMVCFESLFNDETFKYDAVKRFFKKEYSEDKSKTLFDVGNVLHIPINYPHNVHWLYCYVVMRSKCIVLVDSMNNSYGNGKKITGIILQFLEEEYESNIGTGFKRQEWTCSYNQVTPVQDDGCSCGLFVILNAMRVLKKIKMDKPLAIPSISKQTVLGPSWERNFSAEDKRQLRMLMFAIIQNDGDIRTLLPFLFGVGEEQDEMRGARTAEPQADEGADATSNAVEDAAMSGADASSNAVEDAAVSGADVEEQDGVCGARTAEKQADVEEQDGVCEVVVVKNKRRRSGDKEPAVATDNAVEGVAVSGADATSNAVEDAAVGGADANVRVTRGRKKIHVSHK